MRYKIFVETLNIFKGCREPQVNGIQDVGYLLVSSLQI